MAHLVTKLASQKRWEQLEVLPDAEQCSEQEGAELGWGGNGVDQVVVAEAPSHMDGWLGPGWGHAAWDEPQGRDTAWLGIWDSIWTLNPAISPS